MGNLVGVITGDLVESSKLSPEEYRESIEILRHNLGELSQQYSFEFDLFRGDSYQLLLREPSEIFRLAVLIFLKQRAQHPYSFVRQSLAIGAAEKGSSSVKTMSGVAFVLSGRALDEMRNELIVGTLENQVDGSIISLLCRYLTLLMRAVTPIQASILIHYIQAHGEIKHEEIAESVGKSRVNVTKILNASHYLLIEDTVTTLTQFFSKQGRL